MNELIVAANSLICSLCHDKGDWKFDGAEELTNDPWGADRVLVFRRQDYLTCYVGFRGSHALYVLQRVE